LPGFLSTSPTRSTLALAIDPVHICFSFEITCVLFCFHSGENRRPIRPVGSYFTIRTVMLDPSYISRLAVFVSLFYSLSRMGKHTILLLLAISALLAISQGQAPVPTDTPVYSGDPLPYSSLLSLYFSSFLFFLMSHSIF